MVVWFLKVQQLKKLNFVQHRRKTLGKLAADGEANLDDEVNSQGGIDSVLPEEIDNDEEEASQTMAESVEGQAALVQAHVDTLKAKEVADAQAKADAENASKIKKSVASAKAAAARAKQETGPTPVKTGAPVSYGGEPLFQPPDESKQKGLPVPAGPPKCD